MLPMLLALSAGGAAHAGTIVGVMNLAGLTAPFWGHLADRRGLHRQVLVAGLLMVLIPLLFMPAVLALPAKAALAGFLGLGFAAANTAANMFIVEVRPREEWDARIGARRRSVGWARSPDCRHSGSASRRGNISRVFLGYGVCRKSRFGRSDSATYPRSPFFISGESKGYRGQTNQRLPLTPARRSNGAIAFRRRLLAPPDTCVARYDN
jgi:hypothetical protein